MGRWVYERQRLVVQLHCKTEPFKLEDRDKKTPLYGKVRRKLHGKEHSGVVANLCG